MRYCLKPFVLARIHIEAFEKLSVAFALSMGSTLVCGTPWRLAPLLNLSRIKVMAKLDEPRKTDSAKWAYFTAFSRCEVDVRVSTLPSSRGERVVMRLIDKQSGSFEHDTLEKLLETWLWAFNPIGASPTRHYFGHRADRFKVELQRFIRHFPDLNDGSKNIDHRRPRLNQLEGVDRHKLTPKIDMTLRALKAMLRQDPDVVIGWEFVIWKRLKLRVKHRSQGHLVLSTLHTNTAIGAVTRLKIWALSRFCCRILWLVALRSV